MRSIAHLVVGSSLVLVVLGMPRCASAQQHEEGEYDGVAMQQNRGLKVGLGPTLLFPMRSGGPYGGGLTVDGRYGLQVGPTVVAPGARLGGYAISGRFVGLAMPTARLTVPLGPLAPYILGGVGVGGLTNENDSGVAFLGGGGLMIHLGRVLALGAEVTYQTITGTELQTVTLTPAISFFGG